MFKRSAANYSLWPEQRPRRGRPLKFAAGSFLLGAVCATAYGTLFNFTAPATGQGLSVQRVVEPVPIVIAREVPAEAAVPMPPPKPAEIASRPSSVRASAAKVTLPLIGAPPPRPSATDGRGDDGLAGEVRLTGSEPAGDDNSGLLGGDNEPSREHIKNAAAEPKDAATGPKMAAPMVAVPMPRAVPPKSAVVKASDPPTGQAPDRQELPSQAPEPAREPKVTLAPAAKTKLPGSTEVRSERRGVIVLTKRVEPVKPAGNDEAPAATPSVSAESAKAAAAPTELPTKRRGYVVLAKDRKRPAVVARGDDAPRDKPVVRMSKPKKVQIASVRRHRAAQGGTIARQKSERPTRFAAQSRPKREMATRHASRRRQDPLGPMIARATQAFRAFAGSQGFGLSGF